VTEDLQGSGLRGLGVGDAPLNENHDKESGQLWRQRRDVTSEKKAQGRKRRGTDSYFNQRNGEKVFPTGS